MAKAAAPVSSLVKGSWKIEDESLLNVFSFLNGREIALLCAVNKHSNQKVAVLCARLLGKILLPKEFYSLDPKRVTPQLVATCQRRHRLNVRSMDAHGTRSLPHLLSPAYEQDVEYYIRQRTLFEMNMQGALHIVHIALQESIITDNPDILKCAWASLQREAPGIHIFELETRLQGITLESLGKMSPDSECGHEIFETIETIDPNMRERSDFLIKNCFVAKHVAQKVAARHLDDDESYSSKYRSKAIRMGLLSTVQQFHARWNSPFDGMDLIEALNSGNTQLVDWMTEVPHSFSPNHQHIMNALQSGNKTMVDKSIVHFPDTYRQEMIDNPYLYSQAAASSKNLVLMDFVVDVIGKEKLATLSPNQQDALFSVAIPSLPMLKKLASLGLKQSSVVAKRQALQEVIRSDSVDSKEYFSPARKQSATRCFEYLMEIDPAPLEAEHTLFKLDLDFLRRNLKHFTFQSIQSSAAVFFIHFEAFPFLRLDLKGLYSLLKTHGYQQTKKDYQFFKERVTGYEDKLPAYIPEGRQHPTFVSEYAQRLHQAMKDLQAEMEKDLGIALEG